MLHSPQFEPEESAKRVNMTTATQRFDQLISIGGHIKERVADSFLVKQVASLPFERRQPLLDAGMSRSLSRSLTDEVLWCKYCACTVSHGDGGIAKGPVWASYEMFGT